MRPTAEERRQHKRHKLDNSVSVSSLGVFQVTDISRGGFCLRCPQYTPISDSWETDIITAVVSLEGFPAKLAWVSMTENGTHEGLPMIVGVKFENLTKKQNSHLSQLIQDISQSEGSEH